VRCGTRREPSPPVGAKRQEIDASPRSVVKPGRTECPRFSGYWRRDSPPCANRFQGGHGCKVSVVGNTASDPHASSNCFSSSRLRGANLTRGQLIGAEAERLPASATATATTKLRSQQQHCENRKSNGDTDICGHWHVRIRVGDYWRRHEPPCALTIFRPMRRSTFATVMASHFLALATRADVVIRVGP
jgi:hypothetical protein